MQTVIVIPADIRDADLLAAMGSLGLTPSGSTEAALVIFKHRHTQEVSGLVSGRDPASDDSPTTTDTGAKP